MQIKKFLSFQKLRLKWCNIMNINYHSNVVTLDLDNMTYDRLELLVSEIMTNEKGILQLYTYFSSMKGFHIHIIFNKPIHNINFRRRYKDDPKRIIHDLLRPNNGYHNRLFKSKIGFKRKQKIRFDSVFIPELSCIASII